MTALKTFFAVLAGIMILWIGRADGAEITDSFEEGPWISAHEFENCCLAGDKGDAYDESVDISFGNAPYGTAASRFRALQEFGKKDVDNLVSSLMRKDFVAMDGKTEALCEDGSFFSSKESGRDSGIPVDAQTSSAHLMQLSVVGLNAGKNGSELEMQVDSDSSISPAESSAFTYDPVDGSKNFSENASMAAISEKAPSSVNEKSGDSLLDLRSLGVLFIIIFLFALTFINNGNKLGFSFHLKRLY
ncbi:MAG: hypothetical protein LBU32_29340 [Clostridiales bacterium]|jgi:hypothetical protein|nr:hypothetical protein [Clostridiales bacterium]